MTNEKLDELEGLAKAAKGIGTENRFISDVYEEWTEAIHPDVVLHLIAIARAAIQVNEITGEKPTLPAFKALREVLGPNSKMLEGK